VNNSALYSPPCVTLQKGETYQFLEGVMKAKGGEQFISQYYYQRAILIGK